MKGKTLCLYWSTQDKTLNFIIQDDGKVRVELKFGKYGSESFEMSDTQMEMLKRWIKDQER
jgi:hypothetical protein